jgi:hypothetical protein
MIREIDAALEALVRRDVLNGSRVEILFDAPTRDWVARRNAPAIDLYLYDIREDVTRREVQWTDVRDETGRITERRPPARRYRLSYLVTAWTQRPEDEHLLLSNLLSSFVSTEVMPPELLGEHLADQPLPVYLMVALPPTADRSLADVWSALGGELKPSLDLLVIAPLMPARAAVAAEPVRERPRIETARIDPADGGTRNRTVPDGTPATPSGTAPNAAVGEARAPATVPARAGPASTPSARPPRGSRSSGRPISRDEPASQVESISPGQPDAPGRVIRLRGVERP